MHRSAERLVRIMLGAAVVFAVLAPAQAWAQDDHDCRVVDPDTGAADPDEGVSEGGEVSNETPTVDVCEAGPFPQSGGGGIGGESGGAGGAVGRIDAGAGGSAAVGSVTATTPWLLAAGAGLAGSVLRRRRR